MMRRGRHGPPYSIYVLFDPREPDHPRYVGWTNLVLADRLSDHITSARQHPRTYRARWINSLLAQGVQPQIRLVEQAQDYAEAERRWIADLRVQRFRLTNGTDGGPGVLGARWTLTEEQRAALRARPPRSPTPDEVEARRERARGNKNWLGKHHSEETKAKLCGRQHSEETRAKLRAAWQERRRRLLPKPPSPPKLPGMTGKRHSEATRLKLSEARKGKKASPEAVTKRAEALKGHVVSAEARAKTAARARERWARWKQDGYSMPAEQRHKISQGLLAHHRPPPSL